MFKNVLARVMCVAVVTIAFGTQASAQNLVVNPSFEFGNPVEGYDVNPTGWDVGVEANFTTNQTHNNALGAHSGEWRAGFGCALLIRMLGTLERRVPV